MSDGSLRAEDVARLAARIGLAALAVTDHDSMDAVARAAKAAEGSGVRVVPGIEVSAWDPERRRKVHLLCYAPRHPQTLLDFCAQTLRERQRASLAMLEKAAARYPVDEETVRPYMSENGVLYKQHIAAALMDRGYDITLFGALWHTLFSREAGFALVSMHYPDAREALRAIKEAGGLAVLAHPGHYRNFELVPALCALGLDGIEAYHPSHTAEDERTALEAAARHGLLVTGGSDFHGSYRAYANPLAARTLSGEALQTFLAAVDALG